MAKKRKLPQLPESTISEKKQDRLTEIQEARQEKPAIEIRGATLRDGMFCNYVYNHNLGNDIVNEAKIKSDLPVHDDMKSAFKKLHPHLAVVCEEIDPMDINDIDALDFSVVGTDDKVDAFTVTSFKLTGDLGSDGVILIGHKKLSTGDLLKLEAPEIKFGSAYAFVEDFTIHIYDLIAEVDAYMKGKRAPEVQQELFDEENAPLVEEGI